MTFEEKIVSFQQTGNFSSGQEILDKSYQLAESIIYNKYKNFGYTDDLISESHDAIISAIYAFDIENKTKFLTFCSVCINNRIKNFIKRKRTSEKYFTKKGVEYHSYPIEERIDLKNSLKGLSENHFDSLIYGSGSRSMKYRAKKKLINKLKTNE